MKCPVCQVPIIKDADSCMMCGFKELHKEFISTAEADLWKEQVVAPYKKRWYTNILAKRWLHYISNHQDKYDVSISIFWDEMTVLGYTENLSEAERNSLFANVDDWHDIQAFKRIISEITDIHLMVFTIYYKWRTCRHEILAPKYREFFLAGFEHLAQITECNSFKEDTRGWD